MPGIVPRGPTGAEIAHMLITKHAEAFWQKLRLQGSDWCNEDVATFAAQEVKAETDPRDQRIAALEAAVAKAEGERDIALRDNIQLGESYHALRTHRDGLLDQLTARDVAGAQLVKALEWIERAAGNCQACASFREKAREALATAPAAWRK